MEDQSEVKADPSPIIEDENLKKAAKKGVSITISLVMLGFSGWKDLEPGLFWKKMLIPYFSRTIFCFDIISKQSPTMNFDII